jgi:hypothetical protein
VTHDFVVCWWEVFGKIVGPVVYSFIPVGSDMLLEDPIFNPMISHVPGFGTFGLHERCDDTEGSRIVSFNGGRWLRVTYGNEGIANRDGILGIVEQITSFSFGGRGYNTVKGTTFRVDRSVRAWAWLYRWWSGDATEVQ